MRARRWCVTLLGAGLVLLSGTTSLNAQDRGFTLGQMKSERRVALVIGNAGYASNPLRNPVNDARLIASTLKALGFEVIEKHDLDQKEMKRAIQEFGKQLAGGGVGLFYYAGHGMQVNGKNFLIPVGAAIETEEDVEIEAVDVDAVLARMDGARNRLNLVILDACRDNPFARSWRSSGGKGLAFSSAPAGTLIAYATAPGSVAADGTGNNGAFTGALAQHMVRKGLSVEAVFKAVRGDVMDGTSGKQTPWESSSLQGEFYFTLPDPGAVPSTPGKLTCPPGAVLQGDRCLAEVVCPEGAILKGGRCVLPVVTDLAASPSPGPAPGAGGPVTPGRPATSVQRAPKHAFGATPAGYALGKMETLDKALRIVTETFYDPARINPRAMMSAALDGLDLDFDVIDVDGQQSASARRVRVGKAEHLVRLDDITTTAVLRDRMIALGAFLDGALDRRAIKLPYIEYSLINGMCLPLNLHTGSVDPVRFAEMNTYTAGQFGGVGMVLKIEDGQLRGIRVMPGTPAAAAGLQRNDRIMAVDGWPTAGQPLDEVVQRIRGEVGAALTLTVGRDGWAGPKEVRLTRSTIRVVNVQSQLLPDKIGYVQLQGFNASARADTEEALKGLERSAGGPLRGLVLDLRGNPGGLLQQAVEVSELFLGAGQVIVETAGKGGRTERHTATSGQPWEALPMIVLVDRTTAASAEIVAGALASHNRAAMFGGITFGKGTVEVLHNNPDGSGFKLSIAELVIAGSRRYADIGLLPDVELYPTDAPEEVLQRKTRPAGQSITTLRYNPVELEPGTDDMARDYPVQLAAGLLRQHGSGQRSVLLDKARATLLKEADRVH